MPDRPATEPGRPIGDSSPYLSPQQQIWVTVQEHGRQLGRGAQAFADLRRSQDEIRHEMRAGFEQLREGMAPKPVSWWSVVLRVLPFVLVVGGFVWAFARYPDRPEFNASRQESRERIDRVEDRVNEMRLEQVKSQTTLDGILEKVKEQGGKLDRALDRLTDSQRRRR